MLTMLPARVVGLLVGAASALTLAAVEPAQAGIWTPVTSGTTQDITAVEQLGPADLWYATSNGQILRNGTVQLDVPGVSFTDLMARPGGDVALATAPAGRLYRYAAGAWSRVDLANASFAHRQPCRGLDGPYARTWTPTGDLAAITWASATVAYVVGDDDGVVLKTTDAGLHWTDVSRLADGTCRVDNTSYLDHALSDVVALPGSDVVTAVDTVWGGRWVTSDGFAGGAALHRTATAVNCFRATGVRMALDLDNPTRSFMSSRCEGATALGFSEDGGSSYDFHLSYRPANAPALSGLNDVAIAGGAGLVAGNAGALLVSLDGRAVYRLPADGTLSTTDWLTVDKVDADHAVAGGRLGRLVTTVAARTIPDLVAPSGTISGPTTVTVGDTATFTAHVEDEVGGSGLDPTSFRWSAPGVAPATGNPGRLTFTSTGFASVEVSFADRAGNVGSEGLTIVVAPAGDPDPPGGAGDVTAPVGTIVGPATLIAGRSTSFAARVVDEPGGSGVDDDTIDWSVDGVVVAVGNPVPITIATPGRHRLTARFADYAGNLATATAFVTVTAPAIPDGPLLPPTPEPIPTPAPVTATAPPPSAPAPVARPASATAAARAGRANLRLRIVPGCTTPGTPLTTRVTLTGHGRIAQVDAQLDRKTITRDRSAPFTATLPIRGARRAHTVRAIVSVTWPGHPAIRKAITKTLPACTT